MLKKNISLHSGFTLVEMLVVIAIIAILASAVSVGLIAAKKQANDAKCKSNLKNLAAAVLSYSTDNDGYYPYAGAFEIYHKSIGKGGKKNESYSEARGWVNWVKKSGSDAYKQEETEDGDFKWTTTWTKNPGSSHINEYIYSGATSATTERSIKEGSIFKYVGKSTSVYCCPEFLAELGGNSKNAWRSYAMNENFYSQNNMSAVSREANSFNRSYDPSRTALFVEIPHPDGSNGKYKSSCEGKAGKCNKNGNDSTTYTDDSVWNFTQTAEALAPWHKKVGKNCTNVAFLDGHVESIIIPDSIAAHNYAKNIGKGKSIDE